MWFVDVDNDKINNLKRGIISIYEPVLTELIIRNYESKKLNFSINIE